MSNVTLTIGGRDYAVACAAGEESHVMGLGRMIDRKLTQLGGSHTEPRALLFAALLLADEVHELKTAQSGTSGVATAPAIAPGLLVAIAERLEAVASALED